MRYEFYQRQLIHLHDRTKYAIPFTRMWAIAPAGRSINVRVRHRDLRSDNVHRQHLSGIPTNRERRDSLARKSRPLPTNCQSCRRPLTSRERAARATGDSTAVLPNDILRTRAAQARPHYILPAQKAKIQNVTTGLRTMRPLRAGHAAGLSSLVLESLPRADARR